MLTAAENDRMCRVGPDTAMGKTMRLTWFPALLSEELPEPGCDPVHVELLGETYVAFRDGNGNVGILDERCCHRGASLSVGRVEQCGIRCLYHGWLFAADGKVLETPNVPDERFKDRFRAKSYPVREAGGMIWTYLGDAANLPAFPEFPYLDAPDSERLNLMAVIGCNYVQLMEGLLDSSHLSVLHTTALEQVSGNGIKFTEVTKHMQFDKAPRVESEETAFGLHYAAIRTFGDQAETRVTALVAPFFVFNPNGDLWFALVPMSDEKTAFFHVWYDGVQKFGEEPLRSQQARTVGLDRETLEEYGLTRSTFDSDKRMRRSNGFRQDRSLMRQGHFTGMPSFTQEDVLMCVAGGPLRDRSEERLATADIAIAQMYRVLLRSVRRVEEGGKPIGAGNVSIADVRGAHATLPVGTDWRTLVPGHRKEQKLQVSAA